MTKSRFLIVVASMLSIAALGARSVPADGALHLQLDKSTPEADQVLTEAPDRIVLEFSLAPELAVSRVAVRNGEAETKLGELQRSEEDETILWAGFQEPVADGTYTVNWTTSSGDGHPVRGEFSFTVSTGR